MNHTDIPKIQRNAIRARLNKAIGKYGFDEVRLVANNLFQENISKKKLEKEIVEKEKELNKLKKNI